MEQVRVLHVIRAMNRAGAETIIMNLMRSIDRERGHFDFLLHTDQPSDYDAEIESLGGSIYRVPPYQVVNGLQYRLACRKFFAEHPEIQVVHGHISSCSAIYLDEAKKAGCATIAHSHRDSVKSNNPKAIVRRKLYGALIRNVPDIADEFLACGNQAGFDRFGITVAAGPHLHIMKNGICLSDYTCDEAEHLEAKKRLGYDGIPLIGDVARLVPEKNQKFLLEVFALVLRDVPQAKLLIVGRGPQESALREQAESLGISDSVVFLGVRDDVPEILKALDVFAFTSTLEGLGMAVVEAQAAGVPCLVSTAVPAEAIVTDIAERIDLEEGAEAWAARLVSLLNAGGARVDTTASVRAHGYDIAAVADWMADFYERLASQCERGGRGGNR